MGLPAEIFIPALLEALHGIIPSDRNLFDWTDSEGQLVRYYFEGPVDHEINQHYFETFHNKREAEVMPSFREAVTGRAVVHSAEALDRPEFFRSALYNEIWRPQRLRTRTEAVVRGVTRRSGSTCTPCARRKSCMHLETSPLPCCCFTSRTTHGTRSLCCCRGV